MRRRISVLIAAAMLAAAMLTANAIPAFAGVTCPDGSTAINVQGTKTCPATGDPNAKFTCDTSQKGSFSSSHPTDTKNQNKNGSDTNSSQCR